MTVSKEDICLSQRLVQSAERGGYAATFRLLDKTLVEKRNDQRHLEKVKEEVNKFIDSLQGNVHYYASMTNELLNARSCHMPLSYGAYHERATKGSEERKGKSLKAIIRHWNVEMVLHYGWSGCSTHFLELLSSIANKAEGNKAEWKDVARLLNIELYKDRHSWWKIRDNRPGKPLQQRHLTCVNACLSRNYVGPAQIEDEVERKMLGDRSLEVDQYGLLMIDSNSGNHHGSRPILVSDQIRSQGLHESEDNNPSRQRNRATEDRTWQDHRRGVPTVDDDLDAEEPSSSDDVLDSSRNSLDTSSLGGVSNSSAHGDSAPTGVGHPTVADATRRVDGGADAEYESSTHPRDGDHLHFSSNLPRDQTTPFEPPSKTPEETNDGASKILQAISKKIDEIDRQVCGARELGKADALIVVKLQTSVENLSYEMRKCHLQTEEANKLQSARFTKYSTGVEQRLDDLQKSMSCCVENVKEDVQVTIHDLKSSIEKVELGNRTRGRHTEGPEHDTPRDEIFEKAYTCLHTEITKLQQEVQHISEKIDTKVDPSSRFSEDKSNKSRQTVDHTTIDFLDKALQDYRHRLSQLLASISADKDSSISRGLHSVIDKAWEIPSVTQRFQAILDASLLQAADAYHTKGLIKKLENSQEAHRLSQRVMLQIIQDALPNAAHKDFDRNIQDMGQGDTRRDTGNQRSQTDTTTTGMVDKSPRNHSTEPEVPPPTQSPRADTVVTPSRDHNESMDEDESHEQLGGSRSENGDGNSASTGHDQGSQHCRHSQYINEAEKQKDPSQLKRKRDQSNEHHHVVWSKKRRLNGDFEDYVPSAEEESPASLDDHRRPDPLEEYLAERAEPQCGSGGVCSTCEDQRVPIQIRKRKRSDLGDCVEESKRPRLTSRSSGKDENDMDSSPRTKSDAGSVAAMRGDVGLLFEDGDIDYPARASTVTQSPRRHRRQSSTVETCGRKDTLDSTSVSSNITRTSKPQHGSVQEDDEGTQHDFVRASFGGSVGGSSPLTSESAFSVDHEKRTATRRGPALSQLSPPSHSSHLRESIESLSQPGEQPVVHGGMRTRRSGGADPYSRMLTKSSPAKPGLLHSQISTCDSETFRPLEPDQVEREEKSYSPLQSLPDRKLDKTRDETRNMTNDSSENAERGKGLQSSFSQPFQTSEARLFYERGSARCQPYEIATGVQGRKRKRIDCDSVDSRTKLSRLHGGSSNDTDVPMFETRNDDALEHIDAMDEFSMSCSPFGSENFVESL